MKIAGAIAIFALGMAGCSEDYPRGDTAMVCSLTARAYQQMAAGHYMVLQRAPTLDQVCAQAMPERSVGAVAPRVDER